MNLRTHTYAIPALCGLAAFGVLVTADYSIRRMVNGPGYGMAAYVTDVNTRPGAAEFAAAGDAGATAAPPAGDAAGLN